MADRRNHFCQGLVTPSIGLPGAEIVATGASMSKLETATQLLLDSDTPTFAGYKSYPQESTNPSQQTGSAAIPGGFADGSTHLNDVLQGLPAATRIAISGTGVVEGIKGAQYSCTVSLSQSTLQ